MRILVTAGAETTMSTWAEFCTANVDGFDAAELADMESSLKRGETVKGGGGAAMEYEIARLYAPDAANVPQLRAILAEVTDALEETIDTHIYDHGEEPEGGGPERKLVERARDLLGTAAPVPLVATVGATIHAAGSAVLVEEVFANGVALGRSSDKRYAAIRLDDDEKHWLYVGYVYNWGDTVRPWRCTYLAAHRWLANTFGPGDLATAERLLRRKAAKMVFATPPKPVAGVTVYRCGACGETSTTEFERCQQCDVPDQCYEVVGG